MTTRITLGAPASLERTSVERAIAELRMGRPVLLESEGEAALVQSVEDLGRDEAARLDAMSVRQARLVLPAARLKRLGLERAQNGWIGLPTLDARRVATLAFSMEAQLDGPVRPTGRIDAAALELARLALALPAVVLLPLPDEAEVDGSVLRVTSAAILSGLLVISRTRAIPSWRSISAAKSNRRWSGPKPSISSAS